MKNEFKVFVVIPALNEENTIGKVVKGLKKYTLHIIVIDDCSNDNTFDIANNNGALMIKNEIHLGYDSSINKGFELAKNNGADIIITFDADLQHNPADLPKFIKPIENEETDIMVGVRPYSVRLFENFFGMYSKMKIGVDDPLCGFKAYHIKVYNKVGYFDKSHCIGTELIFKAKKQGFRIKQLPIHFKKRKDISRFGGRLIANYKIMKALIKIALSN